MRLNKNPITYIKISPIKKNEYKMLSSFQFLGSYPDKELIGGYHTYGESLGIMVTNKYKVRIPGDIGNAETFNFPVRYAVVKELTGDSHRRGDPSLVNAFLRVALKLQEEGVRAITTSCGFMAFYQKEISRKVDIPVFTSSLLLIPLIHAMAGGRGKVGVISVEGNYLDKRYFKVVGAENVPVVIGGMENQPEFSRAVRDDGLELNPSRMATEMVYVAQEMITQCPNIHSFVLECTQMPPYAFPIQKATGRPVYDITTLCQLVYSSIIRNPFPIKNWFPNYK